MTRSMFVVLGVLVLVIVIASTASSSVITSTSFRLPMGMSSIINDLEAEGVTSLSTVCFITSRGVVKSKRRDLLKNLFGLQQQGEEGEDDEEEEEDVTAFGRVLPSNAQADTVIREDDDDDEEEDDDDEVGEGGIVIAHPTTPAEVALTVEACSGRIVYVPSLIDLGRGEGLFDSLGPAMERILAKGLQDVATLTVIIPNQEAKETIQRQLETAVRAILPNLQQGDQSVAKELQNVFTQIDYVTQQQVLEKGQDDDETTKDPATAAAAISNAVDNVFAPAAVAFSDVSTSSSSSSSSLAYSTNVVSSLVDLAAARQWGPAARQAMERAMERVQQVIDTSPDGFVPYFGELCDATVQQALNDLTSTGEGDWSDSLTAHAIRSCLADELYAELSDLFYSQVRFLQDVAEEEMMGHVGRLRVRPDLGQQLTTFSRSVMKDFIQKSQLLLPKKANNNKWGMTTAKRTVAKRLDDICKERLLAAQATGNYRPSLEARRAITVGMHWLLPKPFGNDFRQEPWMVHATDNLVFVPKDKITNLSPDQVKARDWRNKVVPNPKSREMIFLRQ